MFAAVTWGDVPLLTTPYGGAIKTALAGVAMRVSGTGFGVVGWRWWGIGFVALGLLGFCLVSRRAWTAPGLAVFLALLLSDTTVLVCTRHDWGPVALALALRLLWLGMWLRWQRSPDAGVIWPAALGALAGLMIYDKLLALVLLPALVVLLRGPGGWRVRDGLAGAVGLALGLLPLLVANWVGWVAGGVLPTMTALGATPGDGAGAPGLVLARTLSMGVGTEIAAGSGLQLLEFVFGVQPPGWPEVLEAGALVAALGVAVGFAVTGRRGSGEGRGAWPFAAPLLAAGLAVAGLMALPLRTGIHHWVIVTPLAYVALAQAAGWAWPPGGGRLRRALAWSLIGVLAVLALGRVAAVVRLERAVLRAEASAMWDPSLTTAARWAAQRDDAVFLAANWGTAAQIVCFSGGRAGAVHEVFWGYDGPHRLVAILAGDHRDELFLLEKLPYLPGEAEPVTRIRDDLDALPGWQPAPLPAELEELPAVAVRRYVRAPPAP